MVPALELPASLPLPGDAPVRLAVEVDQERLQFQLGTPEGWQDVGPVLDLSGAALPADFLQFGYFPLAMSTGGSS